MVVRIGEYEIRPFNENCFLLYQVMPEGYETKGNLRKSEDGRYLKSLDKYPTTIGGGLRMVRDRMEKADPTVTADLDRAIERIEAACAEVERKCGELNKRLKAVA